MKLELYMYTDIVKTIRNFKGLSKNCAKMLIDKYSNIPENTLYSILAVEVQQAMKYNYGKLFSQISKYYNRYIQSKTSKSSVGILLCMAEKLDIPPALLAKNILEKHYEINKQQVSRADISKQIKDTTLIEDKDLAYEIFLCVLYDNQYGPISDAIGASIGQEYEVKLRNHMLEHNITFLDEERLRSRGYDKTPDIKLEVPIAVNGVVINWIESKARFGSAEIHERYIKDQFSCYWNRFGPGLVIYWFGFLDILNQPNEKRFIVMDNFPKDITYMNPSLIESSYI